MVGDSNNDTGLPPKLLVINTQVQRLCKAFVNTSPASMKLSKTQLSKIRKPGRILIAMELNTFQKKQTKKIIGSKNTVTNIYRILANDSIS